MSKDAVTPAEATGLAMGMSLPKPKPKSRRPKAPKPPVIIFDIIFKRYIPPADDELQATYGTLQETKAILRALKDALDEEFRTPTYVGEAELSANEIVLNLWSQGRIQLIELIESFNIAERSVEVTA
jgi:hypothetical protein